MEIFIKFMEKFSKLFGGFLLLIGFLIFMFVNIPIGIILCLLAFFCINKPELFLIFILAIVALIYYLINNNNF